MTFAIRFASCSTIGRIFCGCEEGLGGWRRLVGPVPLRHRARPLSTQTRGPYSVRPWSAAVENILVFQAAGWAQDPPSSASASVCVATLRNSSSTPTTYADACEDPIREGRL